jgi:LemA protein
MKLFSIFVFLLILFFSQNTYGQDTTTSIIKSWTVLKTQLQRRNTIVINLTNILPNSSKGDRKHLAKSKMYAREFFKYLDTLKRFDSLTIAATKEKNNTLSQSLSKTLLAYEKYGKFKQSDVVMNLISQLEGTENRISLARREHNETCKTFNRFDLQFLVSENTSAIQVQF